MFTKLRLSSLYVILYVLNACHVSSDAPPAMELIQDFLKRVSLRGVHYREEFLYGNKRLLDEYDFIIVGAGVGGCVVAHRLSEVPSWKVLLIEAGDEDRIFTDLVLISHYYQFTPYNWGFKTTPQKNACLGLPNNQCLWPQGKGVGGSTIINGNIFTRGFPNDFNEWESLGNTGWSFDNVLKYFKKFERINIPELNSDTVYHNTNGLLNVEYSPYKSKLSDIFLKSSKELGYTNIDYNNPNTKIGFSIVQSTIKNGRRMTASKAYLKPIIDRTNLHVIKNSRVVKIIIDPISKQAKGVELVKNGHKRSVFARKEVIVSSGAFNSPKLLMLSGVGPREHLTELGIPVVQDLRVGDNLMEHVAYSALTFGINKTFSVVTKRLLRQPIKTGVKWIAGQGELTSTGTDGLAFFKTKYNGYKQAGPADIPTANDAIFSGNDNRIRKRDSSNTVDCINTFNHLRLCKESNATFGNVDENGRRRRALVPGGDSDGADVEIMFIPASFATEGEAEISFLRKTMGVSDDIYKEVYRDVINKDSWSVWIITMYPESRGKVRLASKNPWAPPLIDPNFFDKEIDVLRIVEGIKFAIRMSETEPFQSIGSKLVDRPIPGCKHLPFGSDEYWVCCVKHLTMQTHHQCGTCKMGPATDPTAVVDPRLRVYGIQGLRVIDASIMPVLPGGHTVAPTYMIGEKGADMIKEDWLPGYTPTFDF
ncbi:hypothetical protein M8J77_007589 [Diaphorina citri]|nr:hypothetical protein M8J77_007589 [Diaphorina citri]